MDFTVADRDSATWQKVKAHLAERLERLRRLNDFLMPEDMRHKLIGQIEEVKVMLQWDEPDELSHG